MTYRINTTTRSVKSLMADGRPRTIDDIYHGVSAPIDTIRTQIIQYRDTPACRCSQKAGFIIYQQRRVGA